MNAVTDHYSQLLAPIYLWMAGGPPKALEAGAADISTLQLTPSRNSAAVDLGSGFGMHSIPLARLGYAVTAIDTSAILLTQLQQLGRGLGIRTIEDDLLNFSAHMTTSPDLILCMGDTLTHLTTQADVALLCSRVADSLAPNGRFVTTFRDYERPAAGDARFIPVRSDSDRIHTCFLEEQPSRVLVHDIVHERRGENWVLHVSHYPKLKLSPAFVVRSLQAQALDVVCGQGPRKMVQIIAVRPG